MILLSLYYGGMAKVCTILRYRISKVADKRIDIMNSIIPGIRTVKMYAWEWPFIERVKRLRRYETFHDNSFFFVSLISYFAL